MVGRARGRDDARADMLCDLDAEAGHAAGTALDEDRLSLLELQRVLDGYQRGEPDQPQRRGFDVREAVRLLREDGRLDDDLLRVAKLAGLFHDTEYRVADLEIGDALSERAHHTGEITTGDVREHGNRRVVSRPYLPVGAVHARRVDIHQH